MAIRFIREERSGPWLMSVNPFDPHPPFDPPEEYLSRYDPKLLSPPLFTEHDLVRQKAFSGVDQQTVEAVDPRTAKSRGDEGAGLRREEMARLPMKNYDGREVKACYYAMIELIDHQLGRIVDMLHETGQLKNTVILFTSDHGELLGDHGLMYKGCRFFESLVHVPLLFSWPDRFVSGLRSNALVELVDIPPTLLDCAGIPVPPSMQGSSLLSLLEGKCDPDRHKSQVVCEYNDALDRPNASHATMTFDGRYKVCLYHGTEAVEIYDLEEDPGEFRNLWEDWMNGDGRSDGPVTQPELARLIPSLLRKHMDAVMRGSDAGIPRTGPY
jgi:arylsulfatase